MSSEPHIRKVRSDDLEEVWRVHVASSNMSLAKTRSGSQVLDLSAKADHNLVS